MIRYDELPEGVAILRVYSKRGATGGASLIACHHADRHRNARNICLICRTRNPDRPVMQLALVPAGVAQTSLFF